MKFLFFAAACAVAGPGYAQDAGASDGVVISNCAAGGPSSPFWVTCDAKNNTPAPIAKLRYTFRILEADRTVPWLEQGLEGTPPRTRNVSGGLEPSETANLPFGSFYKDERMAWDKLVFEVKILKAFDVTGKPISLPADE